jgi:hypothetical protein
MSCSICPHCIAESKTHKSWALGSAVLDAVCIHFRMPRTTLQSKIRTARVSMARQIACYVLRSTTKLSYPEIGKMLNKDHSTVIHAYNLIASRVAVGGLGNDLDSIRAIIDAGELRKTGHHQEHADHDFGTAKAALKAAGGKVAA